MNPINKLKISIPPFLKHLGSQLELKINLIAIALCALFSLFWMVLAAKRYYFLYAKDYWDLAYSAQILWNLQYGNLYNTLIGANFPAEHCSFIYFLLAPFYWIFPDPMLLQYLKIGTFFGASYILFLILKKRINPFIALTATLAYDIAPANISMLRHIYNREPFSIPLVFLIFKAWDDKNYKLYITCCFLLAMVKEQMPLVVMMFGALAFLFIKKDRLKWAWAPFLLGLTIFIVDVFIITPYCRKDCSITQSFYWSRYVQFGKTPLAIFYYVLTHPTKILMLLASPLNVTWYKDLFGIWGILAFLSPQILLPALPLFLKTLLSGDEWEHVVTGAWYASTLTPFIYLATWNTLDHIKNKWRPFIHSLVVLLMIFHAFNYWPLWKPLLITPMSKNAIIYKRMIDQIPPKTVVCSDFYALSFLANRKDLYEVGDFMEGTNYLTNTKFSPFIQMDYYLINFLDKKEELINPRLRKTRIPKIMELNFDDHWVLIDSIEDIALYKKNADNRRTDRLIERGFKPFIKESDKTTIIENTLNLESIELPVNFPKRSRILPLTMYWKCLRATRTAYTMSIKIISNGKTYYDKQRPIGSTIYPTDFWKKNEYIKEKYFCLLPHLRPRTYQIKIDFYNPTKSPSLKEVTDDLTVQ